jgi:hypothetical protein
MDRRAAFFVAAGLLCFALVPVGLEEHRKIAIVVGCAYLLLGVLSAVDARSRRRRSRR